ncbi:MAG: AraC family transcriptional regulator [Planctomycetota bacterium]
MSQEPDFISQQTTESKRFYLNLDPAPGDSLVVVCGGVERTSADYLIERSDFPFFGVELVAEGNGGLTLGHRSYQIAAGSVFAYGPGIAHRIENRTPAGMRKYFLDLHGEDAKALFAEAGLLRGEPIIAGGLAELTDLWDSIAREARDGTDLAPEICQLLSRLLLLKIRQRRLATGEQRIPRAYRTYEGIRRHIEQHYLRTTSIEQVADECDITPVYISRLFKKYSTTGAYQFLLRLRMNHAAELLMHERLKVQEIARRMGFADPFQFSRAFKRVYGFAPSKLSNRDETKTR